MNKRPTPETDAARHDLSDYGPPVPCSWGDWVPAEITAQLEQERDEAREDITRWKTEHEIISTRLRGEKHPHDNGITADDEIIPKLISERDEARNAMAQAQGELDLKTLDFERMREQRDEVRDQLTALQEQLDAALSRELERGKEAQP